MNKKILITAATDREMTCLDLPAAGADKFLSAGTVLTRMVSGVGPVASVFSIMDYLSVNTSPDLIINIGIAGSYRNIYSPGSIVIPASDSFADLGVYENGGFIPADMAGLIDPGDEHTPSGKYFPDRYIDNLISLRLPRVNAITVSTATGSDEMKESLLNAFNPDIETMEGAAVYYLCTKKEIPCIAFRAVSNMVGPRDRSLWKIDYALEQLAEVLGKSLNKLVL